MNLLKLTRRIGESIIIDGKIVLRVLGKRDGEIRVGIEAPREISVDRTELRIRKMSVDAFEIVVAMVPSPLKESIDDPTTA